MPKGTCYVQPFSARVLRLGLTSEILSASLKPQEYSSLSAAAAAAAAAASFLIEGPSRSQPCQELFGREFRRCGMPLAYTKPVWNQTRKKVSSAMCGAAAQGLAHVSLVPCHV